MKVLSKAETESYSTDPRPGEGGFHRGGSLVAKIQTEYSGRKEKRCQNRGMNYLKGSRKVQEANLNTSEFCLMSSLNTYHA